MSNFKFTPLAKPVEWTGRYNRIPGKEPAFKVNVRNEPYAYWSPWKSDEWISSFFVPSASTELMGKSINKVKNGNAGRAGGSFHINEFGQVIVPVYGSYKRFWVGNVSGVPLFDDPRTSGAEFSLFPPEDTPSGFSWDLPYVGMKFNLDGRQSIYFQTENEDVKSKIRLAKPPKTLIKRIASIRGEGTPVRFIVNLHGAVITKKEPDWEPVFVGFIDRSNWFPKEP